MNIVITGAAGYIGTKLTKYFLDSGHKVFAFDNYFYSQKQLVSHVFNHENCLLFEEDVTNWSENLKNAIANSDILIPLAALVGAPLCNKYRSKATKLNQEWFNELIPYSFNILSKISFFLGSFKSTIPSWQRNDHSFNILSITVIMLLLEFLQVFLQRLLVLQLVFHLLELLLQH